MPQIAEWPEIGDILSAAITRAAAGGDTRELMTEAVRAGEARPCAVRATADRRGCSADRTAHGPAVTEP